MNLASATMSVRWLIRAGTQIRRVSQIIKPLVYLFTAKKMELLLGGKGRATRSQLFLTTKQTESIAKVVLHILGTQPLLNVRKLTKLLSKATRFKVPTVATPQTIPFNVPCPSLQQSRQVLRTLLLGVNVH